MSVCHVLEAHFIGIILYPFFSVSALMFSNLLIAHTMSRISDLLISSLENLANHHLLDLEEVSSMIEPTLLDSQKTMPEIHCI
jgi:hypothetical protein